MYMKLTSILNEIRTGRPSSDGLTGLESILPPPSKGTALGDYIKGLNNPDTRLFVSNTRTSILEVPYTPPVTGFIPLGYEDVTGYERTFGKRVVQLLQKYFGDDAIINTFSNPIGRIGPSREGDGYIADIHFEIGQEYTKDTIYAQ
jgi:hypothetical protein